MWFIWRIIFILGMLYLLLVLANQRKTLLAMYKCKTNVCLQIYSKKVLANSVWLFKNSMGLQKFSILLCYLDYKHVILKNSYVSSFHSFTVIQTWQSFLETRSTQCLRQCLIFVLKSSKVRCFISPYMPDFLVRLYWWSNDKFD